MNFSWGHGSPHPSIPVDSFSARISKKVTVSEPGKYRITGTADDGVRIYVDGVRRFDYYTDGVHKFNDEFYLSEGTHVVTILYYDSKWSATLQADLVRVQEDVPSDKWRATFYPSPNFTGAPTTSSLDGLNLSLPWGSGSPYKGIPSDGFSAVFTRNIVVDNPGKYQLTGLGDDGVRIYIDGVKQVDLWRDGVNRFDKLVDLAAGAHKIVVEYYDNKWSATLDVQLKAPDAYSVPQGYWDGTFFSNVDLTGTPVKQAIQTLDFSWGHGSPVEGIPTDSFSAIFEKEITIDAAGEYKIVGKADDGARIYIDGIKVIDEWTDGVHNFNKSINLSKGNHTIKVEYYDSKWSATLNVDIQKVDPTTVPSGYWAATYYPTANLTGTPVKQAVQNIDFSWGHGSPVEGIPTDSFSAIYEKQITVEATGDYKLVGKADDGVRIYVDGTKVIDEWSDGVHTFDKSIKLSQGTHTIKVEYYDSKWSATLAVDIQKVDPFVVPEGYWAATYYPTANLTGTPVKQAVPGLDLSWGQGSPASSIPSDYFSATFTKSVKVETTGNYYLVGQADDGIRVYVDGNKVVDQWTDGVQKVYQPVTLTQGNHTIKVEYYDAKWSAKLQLDLVEDFWKASIFPTINLAGTPVRLAYNELDLYWGSGSPHSSIPTDDFSGIYEKKVYIEKAGKYRFTGKADDGIRIFVDGTKQLDLWKDGVNEFSYDVNLSEGQHTIRVEHYDRQWSSTLSVKLTPVSIQKLTTYTNYNSTYQQALDIQARFNMSQTDKKYEAYVRSDAINLDSNNPSIGYVNGTGWNVRGIPINGWILGKLEDKEKVTIYSTSKQPDGYDWYRIQYNRTWVNPSPTDISYYLNPGTFAEGSAEFYQYIKLSQSAGTDPYEVNQKVLTNKGVLTGKGSVFLQAGQTYNVNEIYLIAHALHETGNGKSSLGTGVKVNVKRDSNGQDVLDSYGAKEIVVLDSSATVYDAIVYNMYGIGAYDSCALSCGAKKAFNEGWTTVDKAIIGGAQFVAEKYIHVGQDTLYKMKWNPAAPGTHQYATDIGWAIKQTPRMYNIYSMLDSYNLIFDVPKYK